MSNALLLLLCALSPGDEPRFVDHTDALGLGPEVVPETVSRLCFADLDGDRYPDAIVGRSRVFLNVADEASPLGRAFREVPPAESGLRPPTKSSILVFADLDGDRKLDAVVGENVDQLKEGWEDHGRRTSWQRGHGDGTFGEPRRIAGLLEATTASLAVGDADRDGTLDLWLGHWYVSYGALYLGYLSELAYGSVGEDGFTCSMRTLPEGASQPAETEPNTDAAGRPTFGVMLAELDGEGRPELLELNYGRRWNRLYRWRVEEPARWLDDAPMTRFDADGIRHGRYPEWLQARMRQQEPPSERPPELPFRSNGNTFDCAVGDVDGDGDFDVFLAEIAHGWAGEASDRSRFLLNRLVERGQLAFEPDPRLGVDRIPDGVDNWNQGDLFCQLADLDHDGRLDLLLSSGDYPDDQRLRVYLQQEDGTFADRTRALGVDHDGSQQLSLADVDADGDLDVLVGQTFNRFTKEQREGRSPRLRLLVNEATAGRASLVLYLEGDGEHANTSALGAVVHAKLADGRVLVRQLIGIGGHAGKQQGFQVHFGLGAARGIEELTVTWPDAARSTQTFGEVAAGRYALRQGGELQGL